MIINNDIHPYFKDTYITLAFSSSNFFIPYLSVTLHSLLENSNQNINYDILIFSKDVTKDNKNIFIKFFQRSNVSIRFVDVSSIFNSLNLYTASHITIETYFRLIVPKVLYRYDKVLFLDSDLIIESDINELFNIDITNYPIAATEECLFSAVANIYDPVKTKKYVREVLKLKDIDTYFQAGVLLFNIKKFNENGYSDLLVEMVQKTDYQILDQDALNQLFADNYLRFDNEWNWPPLQSHMKDLKYLEKMSNNIRNKYLSVITPKIYHFADKNKPWLNPEEDYSTIWWKYARATPFYELVLYRMSNNIMRKFCDLQPQTQLPRLFLMKKFKFQRIKYKILYKLSLGKRRKAYKAKYLIANNQVKYCKNLLKNLLY